MNNYTKKLQNELNNCGKMPIFEIEVKNLKGEKDYVVCDISFAGNSIVAQRIGVSSKEERSKFIASTRLVIDTAFGLDEHLQELHSAVLDDILSGDLYELSE